MPSHRWDQGVNPEESAYWAGRRDERAEILRNLSVPESTSTGPQSASIREQWLADEKYRRRQEREAEKRAMMRGMKAGLIIIILIAVLFITWRYGGWVFHNPQKMDPFSTRTLLHFLR